METFREETLKDEKKKLNHKDGLSTDDESKDSNHPLTTNESTVHRKTNHHLIRKL